MTIEECGPSPYVLFNTRQRQEMRVSRNHHKCLYCTSWTLLSQSVIPCKSIAAILPVAVHNCTRIKPCYTHKVCHYTSVKNLNAYVDFTLLNLTLIYGPKSSPHRNIW